MSETKLKICPFCGGRNVIKTYNNFVPALLCGDCGAIMSIPMTLFSASYEKILAEKWNTRKPVDDVLERLSKEEDTWSEKYNCQKRKGFIDQYSDGFADGVLKAIGFVKEVMGLNEISND